MLVLSIFRTELFVAPSDAELLMLMRQILSLHPSKPYEQGLVDIHCTSQVSFISPLVYKDQAMKELIASFT